MKLWIAALSFACWIQSIYATPKVGLVLVMNHGKPKKGATCNHDEQVVVHTTLYESLMDDDRRYLRRLTDTLDDSGTFQDPSCEDWCEAIPDGTSIRSILSFEFANITHLFSQTTAGLCIRFVRWFIEDLSMRTKKL